MGILVIICGQWSQARPAKQKNRQGGLFIVIESGDFKLIHIHDIR